MGFSSEQREVAVVRDHYTFIIIIHDLNMPNSDFKYYAVGVVWCHAMPRKNINCCRGLVAVIKLFTMDLTLSSHKQPWCFCPVLNTADHLASGIVLAIFMDHIL